LSNGAYSKPGDADYDDLVIQVTQVNGLVIEGDSASNKLVGTKAADMISGFAGSDNINAGAGSDYIDGGLGADIMKGGAGNDRYVVDDKGDRIFEEANSGIDTVETQLPEYMLPANVDNLVFVGSGNFRGTGNELDNALSGGQGADTLNGRSGNDVIVGDSGDDLLTGGSGNDIFVFRPGFGRDMITDFDTHPAGGQDFLKLDGFGITAANFASRVAVADIGADTLVTVDGDTDLTIRLAGIGNATTVTVDDFKFS
jgi:Ca2+-binding RTX toxin-like protein